MLGYETLDAIADAVNPCLLIATLLLPAWKRVRRAVHPTRWYVLVALALATVYLIQGIDSQLGIWIRFGSDYSTHAAFAIALILVWYHASRTWLFIGLGIVAAYVMLMLYQRYHTWIDIATSTAVVGAVVWLLGAWINPHADTAGHPRASAERG